MHPDLFLQAQSSARAGYETARDELTVGAKREHWIWYIFPQIEGLGRSSMAQRFALAGLDDATQYICHPVLGAPPPSFTACRACQGKPCRHGLSYSQHLRPG